MYRLIAKISLMAAIFGVVQEADAQRQGEPERPFDAEQRELAAEAGRTRGADGILPLLELWQAWDEVTPSVTMEVLDGLRTNRRLPAARRAYIDALRARALLRVGKPDEAQSLINELGYIQEWLLAGAFDNEGKRGFQTALPPEAGQAQALDPGARYQGKERPVTWRTSSRASLFGYTNFDAHFRPTENVCGFAATTVHSPRPQPLALWVGAGGAIKVWWNGEEVLADSTYRLPDPDRASVAIGAHRGANRLLIKVCATDDLWGFFARLTDARGGRADVRVDASQMPAPAGQGHGARPARAPQSHLAQLEQAAERNQASAWFELAQFLSWTGADDPAENRARQLAARAADEQPTPEHLELAARLADQRGDAMRFVAKALEVAPRDDSVKLLHAQMRSTGLHAEEALPILRELRRTGTVGLEAAVLESHLYQQMDLPFAAKRVLDSIADRVGGPGWLKGRAEAAQAAGDRDQAVELYQQVLVGRWDDAGARRALVADAVHRRERDRAKQHLIALRQSRPDDERVLRYSAGIYEALGSVQEAQQALAAARELAPEDAPTLVAQAKLLLRMGQSDAAIAALRAALSIRPQDAQSRELLEQIQPQVRTDEQYAVDTEALLARVTEDPGFPSSTLQDLTVNTVFDNGLGSSFRQVAAQIHDEEGARNWRTYSIAFDPTSQRVDVRLARVHRASETLEATQTFEQPLGEPWYRIYYDTRALVVVFPDLEPNDVVELRWRIDDIAHRNLFADYYGDVSFFQNYNPIAHHEYVLITPKDREFYFNEPELRGLEHTSSVDGDRRIYRYVANDVAPIRAEPNMPGMTELAPYLHVSTYRTWQEVGHWYWGLIQDQLYADEELKRTVASLVRGKPDLRSKVIAIHDWVVENTRYVGLEFGIHGYKPYRVPQIVRRGFGDCKDKASLLYTMFREAGIDAHIILVRTRRNGRIRDLPASLSVFDHAIAYVPELDLYIDGTAEHSGVTELPDMDQGVTVLHVWPEGAELRHTPVLEPQRNRRERALAMTLSADGSAMVTAEEIVTGQQAPSYRSTYEAEGTRTERLERALRTVFPGLHLSSQQFDDLDNLEVPVRYRYEARVPQAAQRDGDTLRVPPSVLQDLTRSLARSPTRQYPLDVGSTSSYREQRTVRLPSGARVGSLPDGGVAQSEFGKLELRVEQSGRRLQLLTEFEMRRDVISPEDYPAFRQWVEQADQILRQRLNVEGL